LTVLTSCDPARVLIIKASGKPNVSVTVYGNKNLLPRTYNSDNEKITIKIPSDDTSTKRDTFFYYGLGGWGNSDLMPEFSKHIDSIIIVNRYGKLILDNQSEINGYLLKQRHGFSKRILTIEAK
jgi:hypothetical protein